MRGKVFIIGVGPGAPEYITVKAREILSLVDIVVGYRHSLTTVESSLSRKEVMTITMKTQDEVMRNLVNRVEEGASVAFTATGDGMFSDSEYVDRIVRLFKDVEIIPGISSIQVAAAKSNLPIDKAVIITMHVSGSIESERKRLLEAVKGGRPVILLPRPWDFMPSEIAQYLVDHRVDGLLKTVVYENLTMSNESVFEGKLEDLVGRKFSDLSVMILGVDRR